MTSPTQLFSLQGKTALITGGSGDIGRAIARAFAGAGAAVALNGTAQAKLDLAVDEIKAVGAQAVGIKADISRASDRVRMVEEAVHAFGRIDILVNCAGNNRRKPILEVTEEDYESIMGIHVRGAYFTCQTVAPYMMAQGGGKIIHVGSLTIRIGLSDVSVYGMAKAGLDALTRTQAVEWAQHNIQVNCLAPGFIRTALTEEGQWKNPKRSAWILERTPMRRPGQPDELAGAALLFASPASSFITGQTLFVDGGVLAGTPWW